MIRYLLLTAAAMIAVPASAPVPAHAADSRLVTRLYSKEEVVRVEGRLGVQATIAFADEEHIENVAIGDSATWQVTPNKRANLLFVKPAYRTSHSNMTVSTDRRRYSFELVARDTEACRRGLVTYNLRFTYKADPVAEILASAAVAPPPTPDAEPPPPDQRNSAYTFTGARENIPARVFDTGHATWFRWAEGTTTPAVYAVAADNTESAVSFTSHGDYLVVEQVAPRFILRRGNAASVLYNDAYQTPALDAGSPQPRAVAAAEPPRWPFRARRTDR